MPDVSKRFFGSLLTLLLLLAFATAAIPSQRSAPLINTDTFAQWLQDPAGRLAFSAAWGGTADPLTNAYRALNASITASKGTRISKTCLRDVAYVLSMPGLWAYQMLDSSVKVPEGLLAFSLTHFGNWQECVDVGYESSPAERFSGKMCMVGFQPALGEQCTLRDESNNDDSTERADILSLLLLKLATCVPSTCSASDTQALFSTLMDNAQPESGICLKVRVTEQDCTVHDRPKLDTTDWIAVLLLGAFGVVVVLSTVYDVLIPPFDRNTSLAAFSVVSNGKKLLAVPRGDGDQTLSSVHGVRFLSMCWVVLGHSYVAGMYVPIVNTGFITKSFEEWYRIGITNATLSVDTFFFLSGLLVAYLFFKQPPSKRTLNVPLYYIHRYIRLTPALAMMVLMTATLATQLGWGPLWPTLAYPYRRICRKNWWSTLLYVGNYVNPEEQCVDHSWYLMLDMQLHWLSPLVLIPLSRWPRTGKLLLLILSIGGIASNFFLCYIYEYAPILTDTTDVEGSVAWNKYFYVPTHTRFLPYLVGIALGYVLGTQSSQGKKPTPLTLPTRLAGWFSAAALLLVSLVTAVAFLQPPKPSRGWTAIYSTLYRPLWALGVGTVVYLCAESSKNPVNQFLSWWGFQFLGRLSYCVYLVHATLQLGFMGAVKTASHLEDSTVFLHFAGYLTLSLFLAAVLSLLCETPFMVLEKELLGEPRRQNDASRTVIPPGDPVSSSPTTSEIGDSSNSTPGTNSDQSAKEPV